MENVKIVKINDKIYDLSTFDNIQHRNLKESGLFADIQKIITNKRKQPVEQDKNSTVGGLILWCYF